MKIPKAIFFGDSLTQNGWTYEGGWLSILAASFTRKLDIISRGYSGYNTRACKSLLPILYPDKESLDGCVFFAIFLGANDASLGTQHVSAEEYAENLKTMVHYIQGLGIQNSRILLISLPPIDEYKWGAVELAQGLPLNRHLTLCPLYATACKQVSDECNTRFINLYDTMKAQKNWEKFFDDGLHFSRQGSEFLAHILQTIMEEELKTYELLFPDWKVIDFNNPSISLTNSYPLKEIIN